MMSILQPEPNRHHQLGSDTLHIDLLNIPLRIPESASYIAGRRQMLKQD